MVQTMSEAGPTFQGAGDALPETIAGLERVSWNYWWSWNLDGSSVFRDLDQEVWDECEHNPRRLLRVISQNSLMRMATDPVYIARVRHLAAGFDAYMNAGAQTWAAAHA